MSIRRRPTLLFTFHFSLFTFFLGNIGFAQTQINFTYYVPLPEAQIYTSFKTLYASTGATMRTVISGAASRNGTIVYYDHWEDGYETNLATPLQSTTQIWGDNNPANGMPPGYAVDVIDAGDVLALKNDMTLPRNATQFFYDGRDKIAANKSLSFSRSSWSTIPGSVLADAVEFYNTSAWGFNYTFPIGENIASDFMFQLTALHVMAFQNGTTVQIDKDGNGTIDATATINEGESYQVNGGINASGTVVADKAIQTTLLTGDVGATYSSRWFTLMPNNLWDKSYYAPVGPTVATAPSDVFIFNKEATALTVYYTVQTGSGSFSVPSKGIYRFRMPLGSGGHFYSTSTAFTAVAAQDADAATSNTAYDWGYTLMPESYLTTSLSVGWGPGTDTPISGNGSPVWVMGTKATTLYVDYDGDPTTGPLTDLNGNKYNVAINTVAFQSNRIYDNTDRDQTGMSIYTVDGTLIAGAWGEDPATAAAGLPFLDVGTTIPPNPELIVYKRASFQTDANGNGLADAGDVLHYKIYVRNATQSVVPTATIFDTLSSKVTYVLGSAKKNTVALVDNAAPASSFPLDETGYTYNNIANGMQDSIEFDVTVNAPITSSTISNYVTVVSSAGDVKRTYVDIPANNNTTACAIQLTDGSGIAVSTYSVGSQVCVKLLDNDQNTNTGTSQTLTVTLTNTTSTDIETVTLTETGNNTGDFRGCITTSGIGGQTLGDGTLYGAVGHTVRVDYTDPVSSETCNATASISPLTLIKQLYLTDPTQGLDRIDPVATADATIANTVTLSTSGGSGTVTYDNSSSSSTTTSPKTLAHLTGSGTNRFMLVGVSLEPNTSQTVTSVTYNGVALNLVGTRANVGKARIELWKLLNPASGNNNVIVTFSGTPTNGAVVGVTTFSDVDQTTPLGTFASASGSNALATVNVTSAVSEIVFDVVAFERNATLTAGAGQTQRWNINSNDFLGAGSTEAGAASVTMSWAYGDSREWAIGAVGVKPVSGGGGTTTATFTQNPTMCSGFTIKSGQTLTVTNYVNIISGTMPAAPSISAVLKYGATTIATLTNPSYDSGTGLLTWTTTLGSDVTVPAGQAVVLDVITAQSGVSFQIQYDAQTKPSKITLPTTTVIDVNTIGVYTAAYSGGTSAISAINGETVYIRSTVTDPFGTADITAMNLRIINPSGDQSLVTMTEVASSGCTKTYEYAWVTPTTIGNYTLRAMGDEGYENTVKDSAETSFLLNVLDTGTPCALDFTNSSYTATASYPTNGTLYIQLRDLDQNVDINSVETVTVTVTSSSGDSETLTLNETGINTGIFRGSLASHITSGSGNNNGTLRAVAGASLSVNYVDTDFSQDVCNDIASIQAGVPAIALTKTLIMPSDATALVGDTLEWQIVVSNPGTTTLSTVNLTDTYSPSCLAFAYATPTQTSSSAGSIGWNNLGPIAAGETKTISVKFTAISGCGSINNSVSATAVDQNSTPLSMGPVTSPVTLNNPQMTIVKTRTAPTSASVIKGTNITYQIVVTNTGNTNISTLPLSDNYSDFCLEYVSATPTPSSATNGVILWNNIGVLNAGNNTTITVTLRAKDNCTPSVNTAFADVVFDANGDAVPSAQDTATIITTNDMPVANLNTAATNVNTAVTINVITNDNFGNDGASASAITLQTPPIHGTASIDNNGTASDPTDDKVIYTPTTNFVGNDSLVYQICDINGDCDTAKVYITINCVTPSTPSVSSPFNNACPATTADLTALSSALTPSLSGGVFEWHVSNSSGSALVSGETAVGAGTYYLFERSAANCYSVGAAVTVNIVTCCPSPQCIPLQIIKVN